MIDEEIIALSKQRARRKGRRVWWADQRDLTNQAAVAILGALRHFDPTRGPPEAAYCAFVADRALGNYLLQQSSPVSAARGKHQTELAMTRRAPVSEGLIDVHAVEDAYAALELAERIHYRLVALDESHRGVALRVLLDGVKPAQEAQRTGLTVREVYRHVSQLRQRIGGDTTLWEMLTEFRRLG
jgi:DNA-directed RNA polymerase specialized sigma24 family protein